MLIRALLVIASGFIFIFSPGLPMSLIGRFSPDYKRDLVYWGIGVWFVSNLLSQFFGSLSRQIIYQSQTTTGFSGSATDFSFITLRAFISALLLGIGMLLVLNYKKKKSPEEDIPTSGLALGFGAGLVAQVFTGITMVGAGFQLLFFSGQSNSTVASIANAPFGLLFLSILAQILFRISLLAVSAVQGVLTAQSIIAKKRQFWVGLLVVTVFTAAILSIQLSMGDQIPGQVSVGITPAPISLVTSIYYLIAFTTAFWWLVKQSNPKQNKVIKNK